ncbi:hypothetical protein ACHAW6_005343 [Cyclotella cf. meneghiniana]
MCLITRDINIKSKLEKDSRKRTLNPEEDELTNVLVQTFQVERAPQQMDLASLNSSELSNLKNDDPFMYYSISAVRSATLRGKNVDISILRAAPKSLQSSSVDSEGTVTRQRRVSAECHPDLLYGEMFTDHDLMTSLKNLESGSSRSLGNENNLHEDWLFGYLLELNEAR